MTEHSPDTRDKIRRHRLVRKRPGGQHSAYHRSPRSGLRNNIASDLTGISKPAISTAASKGRFARLDDGSYHTEQFEAWVHTRGDRDFRVPNGMRGTLFECGGEESEPEEVHAVVVYSEPEHRGENGTSGHMPDASIYTLEHELIELRVQTERAKLESMQLKLSVDRGNLIERSRFSKTIADIVVQFRESMRRVGGTLAPSLVGLEDEYEIKRRVDDAMRAALMRLQDRINEMLEE